MTSQAHEITVTRKIFASPAQIYAAFTSAQGWCAWCCETAEADARVGGKYHIYTDGYNAYGEFTQLEPDKVVALTWDGDREPPMQVRILLDEQGNATNLTFTVVVLGSHPDMISFVAFLERIWGHALDNLKDVLETS